MTADQKKRLLPYALGEKKPELVLKNARVIDVFTKTVRDADIAVQEGWIVGVGSYDGGKETDLRGKYVAPGFIDAHVHLESSMVSPELFARKVLPCGTTTVIADPHEIVNVVGEEGLAYLLDASKNAAVSIYFVLPSCVPLDWHDHNGAAFTAQQMASVKDNPRILGLGEVMNYEAVAAGDRDLLEKIELLEPKVIDGHAPSMTGKKLQAYKLAGVQTDHECSTWEQALERLQDGFVVQVREGSAARNLEAIVAGALKAGVDFSRFVFCTDDLHLDDVVKKGHINNNIKKSISLGADPIEAVAAATINAARLYRLDDIGAVAPGFRADLAVLESLDPFAVCGVYRGGVSAEELLGRKPLQIPAEERVTHSVHVPQIPAEKLFLPAHKEFPVISVIPGEIVTKKEILALPGRNGAFVPAGDILKIAVVQRHDGSGRTGVGAIKGFGLKNGAIASTVAHDAHNLIVVGDNDRDMLCAIDEMRRCQGGYTVVSGGEVLETLPLRIAGLFTDDGELPITETLNRMAELCHRMGVPKGVDPFQNLSFVSLPVIPELRITDAGLFDVLQNRFLEF